MKQKPTIGVSKDGPYIVKNLKNFNNSKGKIETKPMMALCRCGGSNTKPYCDGTHGKINFKGGKLPGREPDNRQEYKRGKITISDNPGICSHAGYCDGNMPNLFWDWKNDHRLVKNIKPNEQKTVKTIRLCPSGALAVKKDGKWDSVKRETAINIRKDGPLEVVGSAKISDNPDSKEHYALCRCGASKNKPFCDGSHFKVKFKGD